MGNNFIDRKRSRFFADLYYAILHYTDWYSFVKIDPVNNELLIQ